MLHNHEKEKKRAYMYIFIIIFYCCVNKLFYILYFKNISEYSLGFAKI